MRPSRGELTAKRAWRVCWNSQIYAREWTRSSPNRRLPRGDRRSELEGKESAKQRQPLAPKIKDSRNEVRFRPQGIPVVVCEMLWNPNRQVRGKSWESEMRLGPSAWGSSSEKIPILPQTCVSRKRCLEAALGEREHVILRKGKERKRRKKVQAYMPCLCVTGGHQRATGKDNPC